MMPDQMRKKSKIMPLFVMCVAVMFTLRLVDFASGLNSFVQSAQAETSEPETVKSSDEAELNVAKIVEEEPDHSEEMIKVAEKESDERMAGEKPASGEEEHAESDKPEVVEEPEIPEWRDSTDEDLNFDSIRMDLFKDMSERREALDQREAKLNTREALLKATEKEIDQKYQELTQLRSELEKLLEKQSEEEQTRLKSLVKIYEGMKPGDAARIFNTLDLDVLVAVMSRMSERKLSGILAEMSPERARTVTIIMAEQKQLPTLP